MKTGLANTFTLAGLAAVFYSAYSAPGNAQDVQFLDGGYTELCSVAAHNEDRPDQNVEITGTRLGMPPLEVCTLAIRGAEGSVFAAINYNNRGVLWFAQRDLMKALSDFEQAIQHDPTLAEAYVNRGFTLVALERWADSVTAFDKGIELGSKQQAKAHFNRGIAHEELGNVRGAYQDYLKAAELDPLWEDPQKELTRFSVRSR